MELIPRALVIGAFVPPAPLGQQQVSVERLNRIWTELAPLYSFTQLQMAPDGAMANFIGRTPEDGVTIQPPLIQVRSSITTTADQAADSAQSMIGVILRHLGAQQIFNLGIRHVYTVPLPDNDARKFVLLRILSRDDEDLGELSAGATEPWAGVKYVIPLGDRQYTLTIEPGQQDEMKSLYVDLDAQISGEGAVDSITRRAREAREFISGPVNRYLDQLSELS